MSLLPWILSLVAQPAPQAGPSLGERVAALEQRLERLQLDPARGPAVLCLDVYADLAPLHPTRTLPSGVCELSVVIAPGAARSFRELTAIFVADDVGAEAPPGTEMARTVQASAGERRARFRYRQDEPLPPGRYHVELLADGAPWQSLAYTVRAGPETPAPSFALAPGRTWRYAFRQQRAPELARLEAAVELRATERIGEDTRVEFWRDGALVTREHWCWREGGLEASQRELEGQVFVLNPPQPLLDARAGVRAWEWSSAELGARQVCRQWGPLPLEGPWGRASGYVVRTEQAEGELVHTAEREFVPGLGLVRERIVSAQAGNLVAQQELVLGP